MTPAMLRCAAEIRTFWQDCDKALRNGDSDGANDAFGRIFEAVDAFSTLSEDDTRALHFLCALTWIKVAAALENSGQPLPAEEARKQAFSLLDELATGRISLETLRGLESEESADLVGRLYLVCSKAGRRDAVLWGRCFLEFDTKIHGPGVGHLAN